MGDVLMTTPAIRALKETFHRASITLLTSGVGAQLGPHISEIDKVIVFEAPWMRSYRSIATSLDKVLIEVRQQQFDAAVIFTVYSQNPLPAALFLYQAGIPLRLGYSKENPYELLSHWVPDPEPTRLVRHEVERQMALVATIGAVTDNIRLSFAVHETDRQTIVRKLSGLGLGSIPWFILHPGSRETQRMYPLGSYIEATRMILKTWSGMVLVTGLKAEQSLVNEMVEGLGGRAVSLAGQLSLGELGALIELSPVVVTNNTGPAHLAAAVGTPVVDVYANTHSQHTPWQVPANVLFFDVACKLCERGVCPTGYHPKQKTVTPHHIFKAAMNYLAASPYAKPI
jgi:lipopolysaccharide heptosyltransferase II